MSKFKKIPNFQSDEAEAAFWDTHDSSDYIDWSKAQNIRLINLKPSTRTIFPTLSG